MHHSPSAGEMTDHLKCIYPSQYATEVMACVMGTHPVPVHMGFHLNETLEHDKAVHTHVLYTRLWQVKQPRRVGIKITCSLTVVLV